MSNDTDTGDRYARFEERLAALDSSWHAAVGTPRTKRYGDLYDATNVVRGLRFRIALARSPLGGRDIWPVEVERALARYEH
jgi:hypothetical protein